MPILVLLAFINYFGDAANLFSKGYETQIAKEILKGKNVMNVGNYDERLLQRILINDSPLCPENLVIGSSRIMEIRSTNFIGETFFNNGLSGASIEDLFAIIQMYDSKNCMPKKIIIGLDPWTLNANNGQMRWLSLDAEYERFLYRFSWKNSGLAVTNLVNFKKNIFILELFSPSYFQRSLMAFINKKRNPIVATNITLNNTATKLKDGSLSYGIEYRSPSIDLLEERINSYLSGEIYGIEKFMQLDTVIESKIEFLTSYLLNKNVKVVFFLAPYHPKVYAFIASSLKYNKVIESENYFNSLANKYGVEIIGSFNPVKLGIENSMFYDGMHCNENGIKKILLKNNY